MHFYARPNPTVDKLLRLARGDLDLLLTAMRGVAINNVADLGDIVDYIVAHRRVV
jgi:hypothetical protein